MVLNSVNSELVLSATGLSDPDVGDVIKDYEWEINGVIYRTKDLVYLIRSSEDLDIRLSVSDGILWSNYVYKHLSLKNNAPILRSLEINQTSNLSAGDTVIITPEYNRVRIMI